jgi:hypothetical protein
VGKHETGYARIDRDFYPTPTWVTETLADFISIRGKSVWECACGNGRMSEALAAAGAEVFSSDIVDRGYRAFNGKFDFISSCDSPSLFDAVITNPPFGRQGRLAERFIAAGIQRIGDGFLALLLPADFDSAKTRAELFGRCPEFVGKLVLTRRIKWFEHPARPGMQPKENSAWFLWGNVELGQSQVRRTPVIRYAPQPHAVV